MRNILKSGSLSASTFLRLSGAIAAAVSIPHATAAIVYDEAGSGDLSNSGLTPTLISVAEGENQVFGTTGTGAAGPDRDYFTFTVPAGLELVAVAVLPGTTTAGVSFFGVESGSQVTVPPNAGSAAGLLGWHHYTPADGNIINELSIPAAGSSGFTPPLGAGSYAFWVQELSPGTYNYGFDFQLLPAAVPESGPGLLGCAAAAGLVFAVARTRKTRAC